MRALLASGATVGFVLLAAFFATDRLCLLHEAYELRRAKIEKESWLLGQCRDPIFFTHMGEHTTLCQQVEATARIGAAWYALNTVAESLPVYDALGALQRLTWPVAAAVALVCLLCPSLLVAHYRAHAHPQYYHPEGRTLLPVHHGGGKMV